MPRTISDIRLEQAELRLQYLYARCRRTSQLTRTQPPGATAEQYEEDYYNAKHQELEVEALKLEIGATEPKTMLDDKTT